MFARVSAASVEQENAVNMMQLDMMRLQTLQTQIGNVSLQATLIIGFAVAMLCGDNMLPLVDDQGSRCLFKSWVHMAFGGLFFLFVTACIAFSFIVVVLASYLKQASQQAALLVSTRASHANTQLHIREVFRHFVRSIACFIISAALLIWIFAGLPGRVPYHVPFNATYPSDGIERMDNGEYTIVCIDKHSAADNSLRDIYMLVLSGTTTLLIVVMVISGYRTYASMEASYEPRQLLSWYSRYKTEQKRLVASGNDLNRAAQRTVPINSAVAPHRVPQEAFPGYDSDLESVPGDAEGLRGAEQGAPKTGSSSSWTSGTGTAPLLAAAGQGSAV